MNLIILTITVIALISNFITMYELKLKLERLDDVLIDIEMLTLKVKKAVQDVDVEILKCRGVEDIE